MRLHKHQNKNSER